LHRHRGTTGSGSPKTNMHADALTSVGEANSKKKWHLSFTIVTGLLIGYLAVSATLVLAWRFAPNLLLPAAMLIATTVLPAIPYWLFSRRDDGITVKNGDLGSCIGAFFAFGMLLVSYCILPAGGLVIFLLMESVVIWAFSTFFGPNGAEPQASVATATPSPRQQVTEPNLVEQRKEPITP
jgi:hypothetical protein